MAKKMKLASKTADLATLTVTWTFSDGHKISLSKDEVPPATWDQLALHGAFQKGCDSYAGAAEAVAEGLAPDSLTFAKAQATRVIEDLKSGLWATRETGPSRLAVAIAEVMGGNVTEVAERLRGMRKAAEAGSETAKDNLAKIASHKGIKAVMARLEREALERKEKALSKAADNAEEDMNLTDLF